MTYTQLPGGPPEPVYAARLDTCAKCRYRVGPTCKPSAQLTTVLARLPGGRCPSALWPDQKPPSSSVPTPSPGRVSVNLVNANRRVAVAIICHNQCQYLAEAIRSVRHQTAEPAEVLVVNAGSNDGTEAVAKQFGDQIRYIALESSDLAKARWEAYAQTEGEFLVTLDADDMLGHTYLADAVDTLDRRPTAGIAYTQLTQFGTSSGILPLDVGEIHRSNWIHSGSVVRRACLDQLTRAEGWPVDIDILAHHDWRLWRAVLRRGWTAAESRGIYHYRRHSASLTARMAAEETPWAVRADLKHEPIDLFIPASGRRRLIERLPRIVLDAAWGHRGPLSLRVAVTTDDPRFLEDLNKVTNDLIGNRVVDSVRIYRDDVGQCGLADFNRREKSTHRAVQVAMSRIYSRALAETTSEYLWILEDDIGPPADALPAMLAGFDHSVASVALPYLSRFQASYVVWSHEGEPYRSPPFSSLFPVGGNGFGCVVLRRSWFSSIPIRSDRSGDYDPEFYRDLSARGGIALVDWSRPCSHG